MMEIKLYVESVLRVIIFKKSEIYTQVLVDN